MLPKQRGCLRSLGCLILVALIAASQFSLLHQQNISLPCSALLMLPLWPAQSLIHCRRPPTCRSLEQPG